MTVAEVVRLNSNGTIDTTFALMPNEVSPIGLAIQTDGKILAVGTGQHYTAGYPMIRNGIVRINTNGSIDTSFSPVGITNGERVSSVAIQSDGKLVLVGDFTKFSNTPKNSIVRLLNNQGTTPAAFQKTRVADFDGDGKADASVLRSGTWYIQPSGGGNFYGRQFGSGRDRLASADYDGDGKTDIAVWRDEPTDADRANFYIFQSLTSTVRVKQFGRTGDSPVVVGDWDNDGKADPAVYRNGAAGGQSYFFYRPST